MLLITHQRRGAQKEYVEALESRIKQMEDMLKVRFQAVCPLTVLSALGSKRGRLPTNRKLRHHHLPHLLSLDVLKERRHHPTHRRIMSNEKTSMSECRPKSSIT